MAALDIGIGARRPRRAGEAARPGRRHCTGTAAAKVPAIARSLHGRTRVSRTLMAWLRNAARIPGLTIRQVEVNEPGAMLRDGDGRLIGVMAIDVAEGQIQSIRSVVNPDKLRHLGPVGDLRALLAQR